MSVCFSARHTAALAAVGLTLLASCGKADEYTGEFTGKAALEAEPKAKEGAPAFKTKIEGSGPGAGGAASAWPTCGATSNVSPARTNRAGGPAPSAVTRAAPRVTT